jgi:cytochrome c oxidase subunit III
MATETNAASTYRYRTHTNRIGLWLFILSDAFVFGGLLVARFYLYPGQRPELDQGIGLVVTALLLVSSFFYESS